MPTGFVDCYGNIGSVKNPMSRAREKPHTGIISRKILMPIVGIVIWYGIWKIF